MCYINHSHASLREHNLQGMKEQAWFVDSLWAPSPSVLCSVPDQVCVVYDQVWDESLARSAESWAATCIWDHGPPYLLRYLGQNLSVRTGKWVLAMIRVTVPGHLKRKENLLLFFFFLSVVSYRSILQLVKPWYDEVKDYVFPFPHDCNPTCPMRCFGPMCTHYTQVSETDGLSR